MSDDSELGQLEAALAADPTNLEIAWKYWSALGSWRGCDVRSGGYVVRAFRPAALKSAAGVVAFAQAYKQLFDESGEGPRRLDPEFVISAESAVATLSGDDRWVVEWLLDTLRHD